MEIEIFITLLIYLSSGLHPVCGNRSWGIEAHDTQYCIAASSNQLAFLQAGRYCKSFLSDGKLVEIWSGQFQNLLSESLNKNSPGLQSLIGLKYFKLYGEQRWLSEAYNSLPYKNGDTNSTACMTIDHTTGSWEPRSCDTKSNYLCMAKHVKYDKLNKREPQLSVEVDYEPNGLLYTNPARVTCQDNLATEWTLSAFVEVSGSWVFISESKVTRNEHFMIKDGRCIQHANMNFSMSLPESMKAVKGNKTLRFKCMKHNSVVPSILFTNTLCSNQFCAISNYIYFYEPNSRPILTSPAHQVEGKSVYFHGTTVTYVCEATCKGHNGGLIWNLIRETTIELKADDPGISVKEDNLDICTKITSTVNLTMSVNMTGTAVACTSYIKTNNERVNLLWSDSPQMNVEYGPGMPKLSVYFDAPPSFAVLGWNLTSTCSGCCVSDGTIYWTIIYKSGHPLTDQSLGDLRMAEQSYVENIDKPNCAKFVTSQMTFRVTSNLEGSRVQCSTWKGAPLKGWKVKALSKPIRFKLEKRHHIHIDLLYDVFPYLILFMVFTILMMIIRWRVQERREMKRETEERAQQEQQAATVAEKYQKRISHHYLARAAKPHPTSSMKLQGHGTCVDSGRTKKVRVRTSLELAEKLNIPLAEASKRFRAQHKHTKNKKMLKSQKSYSSLMPWRRKKCASSTAVDKPRKRVSPKHKRASVYKHSRSDLFVDKHALPRRTLILGEDYDTMSMETNDESSYATFLTPSKR